VKYSLSNSRPKLFSLDAFPSIAALSLLSVTLAIVTVQNTFAAEDSAKTKQAPTKQEGSEKSVPPENRICESLNNFGPAKTTFKRHKELLCDGSSPSPMFAKIAKDPARKSEDVSSKMISGTDPKTGEETLVLAIGAKNQAQTIMDVFCDVMIKGPIFRLQLSHVDNLVYDEVRKERNGPLLKGANIHFSYSVPPEVPDEKNPKNNKPIAIKMHSKVNCWELTAKKSFVSTNELIKPGEGVKDFSILTPLAQGDKESLEVLVVFLKGTSKIATERLKENTIRYLNRITTISNFQALDTLRDL
jgi:hypothetical protein